QEHCDDSLVVDAGDLRLREDHARREERKGNDDSDTHEGESITLGGMLEKLHFCAQAHHGWLSSSLSAPTAASIASRVAAFERRTYTAARYFALSPRFQASTALWTRRLTAGSPVGSASTRASGSTERMRRWPIFWIPAPPRRPAATRSAGPWSACGTRKPPSPATTSGFSAASPSVPANRDPGRFSLMVAHFGTSYFSRRRRMRFRPSFSRTAVL